MIWKKLILKEVVKTLLFILLCFYLLYALMDYSMHMRDFQSATITERLLYYFYNLIKRLELLLPIAFMLAIIRSLSQMNRYNELLALQVGGLSFQTLIRPLILFALFLTGLVYINYEWALPKAMNTIDAFQATHIKKKPKKQPVNVIYLKDGGRLIYQDYDAESKTYEDVFYLISFNELYHIRKLQGKTGYFVDYLKRGANGMYELIDTYDSHPFLDLNINHKKQQFIPPENRSLSALYFEESTHENLTNFYYKLVTPLFCLLVACVALPYTFRYERGRSSFFLYVYGIFGFITFYMLINFVKLLGGSGYLSPSFGFISLTGAVLLIAFKKMRSYV